MIDVSLHHISKILESAFHVDTLEHYGYEAEYYALDLTKKEDAEYAIKKWLAPTWQSEQAEHQLKESLRYLITTQKMPYLSGDLSGFSKIQNSEIAQKEYTQFFLVLWNIWFTDPFEPAKLDQYRERFDWDFVEFPHEPNEWKLPTYKHTKRDALNHCLLGGAVGDALGLPFEGVSGKRSKKLFKNHQAYNLVPYANLGMVSDDTEHAVMTVQSYISSQGDASVFRTKLRMHLRLWLLGLPAGIGMATGRALFRLWAFLPNSGVFSAGNGPAMRAAVLGVLVDDIETLREFITISTHITHTDPKAVEGAMAIALCAWLQAHQPEQSHNVVSFVTSYIRCDELKSFIHDARRFVAEGKNLAEFMQERFQQKYVSGYMYHTIPAVFFAYIKHQHDPVKGLQCLINAGGDVDTTCAIAGGMWGVQHGAYMYKQIQGKWAEPKITPRFLEKLSAQVALVEENPHQKISPVRFGGIVTLIRNLVFFCVVLLHGFRRLLPPY